MRTEFLICLLLCSGAWCAHNILDYGAVAGVSTTEAAFVNAAAMN